MGLLSNITAIAGVTGLFLFYRWLTRRPSAADRAEKQSQEVRDFLRFSWDVREQIHKADSQAELEACHYEIDAVAQTFQGLVSSQTMEQHLSRLTIALELKRARIQKRDQGKPSPR